MIIVAKVAENRVEAGVISGDAAHFGSNYNAMMKTLMTTWHPFEGATGSAKCIWRDRFAQIHHPRSHRLGRPPRRLESASRAAAVETIIANGPNDEEADLGVGFLGSDLNNRNVQRTYQIVQNGGLRNTAAANGLYYALNNDMSRKCASN